MAKVYRRLTCTNDELVATIKRCGSMAQAAKELDVGYQTLVARVKLLRDEGIKFKMPGKKLELSAEAKARLQAILDQ